MGPPFLSSYPKECHAPDEGTITTYFKHLGFDTAGPSGIPTHDFPDAVAKSTTIRLPQQTACHVSNIKEISSLSRHCHYKIIK
jgi:hypothetical protein